MKLFKRTDTTQVPAELQPYYDEPAWKVWVRRAIYVILALLVLFAIIWAGWAVYKSVTDDGNDKPKTPITQNTKDNDDKNKSTNDDTSSTNETKDTPNLGAKEQSGTDSSSEGLPSGQDDVAGTNKETTSTNTTIPKTGPEDVLAIAAGSAVFGAFAHYYVTNRRRLSE